MVFQQRVKHEKETSPSLLVQHLAFSDMMMGAYLLIVGSADAYFRVSLHLHLNVHPNHIQDPASD